MAGATAAAIVDEATREAQMVETALDHKGERPVFAADLAAAIDLPRPRHRRDPVV